MDWDTFNERAVQRRLLEEVRRERRERILTWACIISGVVLFWYVVTAVVWGLTN